MATIKWKNKNNWETFYYGAFENIKADLRNIIKAINNMAAAVRMRCRRDKNLSDIYNAAEGRINLGLIGDCSALPPSGASGRASNHHHDSRYIPLIEKEERERKAEDDKLMSQIKDLESRLSNLKECHCS